MRLTHVAAALAAAIAITGCGTGDDETSGATNSESQPTVELVTPAGSNQEIEELRRRVSALEESIRILAESNIGNRVTELERQVGVNSIHRNSITNLWDETADLQTCIDAIRRGWTNQFAPVC